MKWQKYGQIRLAPGKDEFEIHIYKRERGGWLLTCEMLLIEKQVLPIEDDEEAQVVALQIVSDKLDERIEEFAKMREELDNLLPRRKDDVEGISERDNGKDEDSSRAIR